MGYGRWLKSFRGLTSCAIGVTVLPLLYYRVICTHLTSLFFHTPHFQTPHFPPNHTVFTCFSFYVRPNKKLPVFCSFYFDYCSRTLNIFGEIKFYVFSNTKDGCGYTSHFTNPFFFLPKTGFTALLWMSSRLINSNHPQWNTREISFTSVVINSCL